MKKLSLLSILIIGISVGVLVTSACGGFFCTTTPVDQSAERIIFTINGDGTITTIVGIEYEGAAEDFSWILPVPSPPELDVAETESLDLLQQLTEPRIIEPQRYCDNLIAYGGRGGGGGGGGMFVEEGNVGPYNYAILGSDDSQEVINWLRENGYRVEEVMEPLIQVYVEEGMYFVAMKLSQEFDVGDIQPVVLTYEAENPMIPIRLTAVAAVDDMPILTWVFADTQYTSENFANPIPNFADFRATHRVNNIGNFAEFSDFFFDDETGFGTSLAMSQYLNERDRIQADFDGKAVITEFASPSAELIQRDRSEQILQDPFLMGLIEDFPYLTRLRAQMSPEQMTLDPVFVPAPDKVDLLAFELADYIDPLHYWGCSSRTAFEDGLVDRLPTGRTTIPAHNVTVAHPDDWQFSEFTTTLDGITHEFYVFAPESVTSLDIRRGLGGDVSQPMLIMTSRAESEYMGWSGIFFDHLAMEFDYANLPLSYRQSISVVVPPYVFEDQPGGLAYAMLTSNEDWEANRARYEDMMRYIRNYEYFLDDDLRHTLILGWGWSNVPDNYPFPAMFGYPDGWIERVNEDGVIVVTPEDESIQAEIRLLSANLFGYEPDDNGNSRNAMFIIDDVASQYGIDPVQAEEVKATIQGCINIPLLTYQNGNENGVVAFNQHYALVVSSVDGAISEDLMQTIANSMDAPFVEPFSPFFCGLG